MDYTKTASLLAQARNKLVDLKTGLATAHEKVASYENQLSAYKSVLELVKEGLIDPIDVFEKLSEFQNDPMRPELIKQAANMNPSGQHAYQLGIMTDLGKGDFDDGNTAEDKLVSRIKNIIED